MDSAASTLRPIAAPALAAPFLALTIPVPDNLPIPDSTLPQQAALVGVHIGSWPLITGGKSTAFMEGGQVRALDSFGDTASHLPDCCSFIRIGVGCGRALSTVPLSGSPSPSLTFARPNLSLGTQRSRTGVTPYMAPGQIAIPQGCVPELILGYPNRVRAGSAERTRLGDGEGSSYY